jgi:hypothetical protein
MANRFVHAAAPGKFGANLIQNDTQYWLLEALRTHPMLLYLSPRSRPIALQALSPLLLSPFESLYASAT